MFWYARKSSTPTQPEHDNTHTDHRGHNIHKYVPQLPGQETATFPIKHNNEIRDPSELPTSDIIVIGAGPSAMDMVQEACITQKATNVHVVARIAHWYVLELSHREGEQ